MTIQCVAVVGAGTMGAGIAQVCAQAGWQTNLYDAFPEGLERGMERIEAFSAVSYTHLTLPTICSV